jgi:Leucine-rich repeat (LRR) protein
MTLRGSARYACVAVFSRPLQHALAPTIQSFVSFLLLVYRVHSTHNTHTHTHTHNTQHTTHDAHTHTRTHTHTHTSIRCHDTAHTQLRNLTELNLRGNQISCIPEAFATLRKLERLNLGDNLIGEDEDDSAQIARLGSTLQVRAE